MPATLPSSVFLRADPSATGVRLAYQRGLADEQRRVHVDPTEWNTPTAQPRTIIQAFFRPASICRLARARSDRHRRSLEPDSPTVILDADTGERIVHFDEPTACVCTSRRCSSSAQPCGCATPPLHRRHSRPGRARRATDRAGRPFEILRDG
jgi:hypothetical protein